MYSALIFDLDGVLIESEPIHDRAGREAMQHFGFDVPDHVFDRFRGTTNRDLMTYAVREYATKDVDLEALIRLKVERYHDLVRDVADIPGALTFVRAARSRFPKMALTTSATKTNQTSAFDKFGLAPYFDVVVTAQDISRTKPDPEPYLLTTQRLAVAPEEAVVIEDSTNGVRSAAAAGCTVVGFTSTFDQEALVEAGAHLVIDTFEELRTQWGWDGG